MSRWSRARCRCSGPPCRSRRRPGRAGVRSGPSTALRGGRENGVQTLELWERTREGGVEGKGSFAYVPARAIAEVRVSIDGGRKRAMRAAEHAGSCYDKER